MTQESTYTLAERVERVYGLGCSEPMDEEGLAGSLGRITANKLTGLVFVDTSILPLAQRYIADGSIDPDQADKLTKIYGRIRRILFKSQTKINPEVGKALVDIVKRESQSANQLDMRTQEFSDYNKEIAEWRELPAPSPVQCKGIYEEFRSALKFLNETLNITNNDLAVGNLAYALAFTVQQSDKYAVMLTRDEAHLKLFSALAGLIASKDFSQDGEYSEEFVDKLGGLKLRITECDIRNPLQSYKIADEIKVENIEGLPWNVNLDENQKKEVINTIRGHVQRIIHYKANPNTELEQKGETAIQTELQFKDPMRNKVEKIFESLNGNFRASSGAIDYFTRLFNEINSIARKSKELGREGLEQELSLILKQASSNEDLGVSEIRGLAAVGSYASGKVIESPGEAEFYELLRRKTGYKVSLSTDAENLLNNIKFLAKGRTLEAGSWVDKNILQNSIGVDCRQLRQIIKKANLPSDRWPMGAGKKRFLFNETDLEAISKTCEESGVEIFDLEKLEEPVARIR